MEPSTISAVGVWFYSVQTDRYLYLMRHDSKNKDVWGLPGGKIESNENFLEAIHRECQEELGCVPNYSNMIPIEKFISADARFSYNTFFSTIDHEFIPILNHEHKGYAWVSADRWPKPLHPGLWNLINFDEIQNKIEIIKQQAVRGDQPLSL